MSNKAKSRTQLENIGIGKLMEELKKRNPDAEFEIVDGNAIKISGIEPEDVKCPEGYYPSERGYITNQGNTLSGSYEVFMLHN